MEFRKFLRQIDQSIPLELDIHLILENYGTHVHPRGKGWQEKLPRFHLHFSPRPPPAWMNLVERWIRELTHKRIRRGSFAGCAGVNLLIEEFLAAHNDKPRPFVWMASAERIQKKISHCKYILGTTHSQWSELPSRKEWQ